MFLAEKQKQAWFERLNLSKIDLGSGARKITKNGKFYSKYNIVIEDLDTNE
jgi:hypothetical protein